MNKARALIMITTIRMRRNGSMKENVQRLYEREELEDLADFLFEELKKSNNPLYKEGYAPRRSKNPLTAPIFKKEKPYDIT